MKSGLGLWAIIGPYHTSILARKRNTIRGNISKSVWLTTIILTGYMQIISKKSPNFFSGRGGKKPEIVVLHIMAGTLAGTDTWFGKTSSQVSSHYGIGADGTIHQYVDEKDTAWANGRVSNPTSTIVKSKGGNPNQYSISIEHEGNDLSKQPNAEIEASAALVADICSRWGIPIDREHIIGHYEIYSIKPNCPATDKSIIDKIINLSIGEEPMNKDFVKVISEICGKDYGLTLNDGEQQDAYKRIKEKFSQLEIGLKQCIMDLSAARNTPPVVKEVVVEKIVEDTARIEELEKELTSLRSQVGEATKWETLKSLLRELFKQ